ncbi:MAG: protein kinase domain-containing protein [Actinomycetota bacterium]
MARSETSARLVGDRYVLETPLGKGGMGVVWRAHDNLLQRKVAIKEIKVPTTMPPDERDGMERRVLREARTAAGLNHPGVVAVYDVLQDEAGAFIIMELVDAPTLSDLVERDGPLTPQRAAEIGLDILDALELAHSRGIVHRDVKPGNVMVPAAGPAKLADFGIASVTGDPKLTATGMILGSPSFMAPEQARDAGTSPATDLWALGGILYYAIEGRPPFDKGQPIPTLTAVLGEEPDIDRERAGPLGPAISAALTKEPAARPAAGELRRLLEAGGAEPTPATTTVAEETDPVITTPSAAPLPRTTAPRAPRPAGRRTAWIVAAVIAAAALVAVGVVLVLGDPDTPPEAAGPERDRRQDRTDPSRNEVPAGSTRYTDDEIGYTVVYPSDWSISDPGTSNSTDFRDEATGTYLRVDWVTPPNGTPEEAWAAAAERSDFDTIGIDPTTYKGMDAALWEYTYSEGGAELHAYNLGFITDDGTYGMALNFQTRAALWDSSQDLWEQLKAGFRAPE